MCRYRCLNTSAPRKIRGGNAIRIGHHGPRSVRQEPYVVDSTVVAESHVDVHYLLFEFDVVYIAAFRDDAPESEFPHRAEATDEVLERAQLPAREVSERRCHALVVRHAGCEAGEQFTKRALGFSMRLLFLETFRSGFDCGQHLRRPGLLGPRAVPLPTIESVLHGSDRTMFVEREIHDHVDLTHEELEIRRGKHGTWCGSEHVAHKSIA